ncbi:Nramp family divalent metal transporter [Microbacterium sp. EYE_5]|uniref:Nramp family divalent metal transporter n=1 Tax=unclassified Microbacterium TaxID=2609290 RepID=UPI0020055637|nr:MULTISPECIES: Nramp family divalent metal transporter [unclassified Microbacterium]MCK6079308.1 Nramp family divalent metal transporter [Microbacterium sp. EYE_382]MCK6084578.1 Nramp family divalent metal transporter [Microbacterium sp. EYE_384]MCK6123193.1 Nramp family divalent metal transporter [Microbacterium sp. EYE_80]MCK6125342.1 Nramp family divalent metal transporter [Microbacterium sp. EYE_79]MCK6140262.1 Nramp family divalent metal transporter [Microbacterium sp. EYE_39]
MPKTAAPPIATPARTGRRVAWLLGPALVAGVAYLDPGNVASNMTAGARYGYLLVWVVVVGNVMAWLIQYLSAKLGIVTGQSLPEVIGTRIRSNTARRAYWLQAELVAMATDVAEIIGGAVALWLLFGVPLVWGGLITGAVSIALLLIQSRRGARSFEFVIIGLMAIIALGFTYGVFIGPPEAAGVALGLLPRFDGADSVLLAASILGATIMPHAIYAHSSLARDRFRPADGRTQTDAAAADAAIDTRRVLRATRWDVTIALAIAGTVNLCILLLAAANLAGVPGTDSLEGAYAALQGGIGPVVATLFAVGLLASGLASSAVGAYAGAEIMQGLLRIRIPLLARRLVTLVPALAILAIGVDPTFALILSQVILSFGIPFALIPLVALTANRGLLGAYRNRAWTTAAGILASVFLVTLNGLLLWLTLFGG